MRMKHYKIIEADTFNEAKQTYMDLRSIDRLNIAHFLQDNGFSVSCNGGMGYRHYVNNQQIKEYDLSTWKYVEAIKNGKLYYISLQCFDCNYDKNHISYNYHTLIDRIGISVYAAKDYENKEQNKYPNAIDDMHNTGIDLPMNEEKLNDLLEFINKL